MNIDAIVRLFSSNSLSAKTPATKSAETTQEASSPRRSEAVEVDANLGKVQGELTEAERQEKVARLKKQVSDGTYSPGSREVASALARELFA